MANNTLIALHTKTKVINSLLKLNLRPKLQFFTWKLGRDILPIRDKLTHLGMSINGDYPFCFKEEENIDYIFKNYNFIVNIWNTFENNFSLKLCLWYY